jgi:2-methylisocitrate lyase-like PEP mutase family enzyme
MESGSRRDFIEKAAALTGGVLAGGVLGSEVSAQSRTTATRPLAKTTKLRALLKKPGIHVVPEAYSVFTARLAELHEFEAIYIGGNMMSAMYLGLEDYGVINSSELVEIGGRIAGGVSVPAIVDADQGGETSLNVYRTIRTYEQAGIAGFHIEDTRNPKHMGRGASELMPLNEMVERIVAAVEARTDPDFLIICRTDCLGLGAKPGDADEAIRRGNAFAEAGGDAFFCVGMKPDQVDRIAGAVPIPLIALNIPMGDVKNTRLRVNIHAVQVYQPAVKLYDTMMTELKEQGQFPRRDDRRLSPEITAKVLGSEQYQALAARWAKTRRS